MRVRNRTGIPQAYVGGGLLPPNVWVTVGIGGNGDDPGISLPAAHMAMRLRHVDVECAREDLSWDGTLWKEADGTHILWHSPFSEGDGYGTAAENMVLALWNRGLKAHPEQCWFVDRAGLDPRIVAALKEPMSDMYRVGVCMATPGQFRFLPTPYRIGITMYESDDPLEDKPEWRHEVRNVDRLVVPAPYSEAVFRRFYQGPIDVCPLAVNPLYYVPTLRKPKHTGYPKDSFTFVTYGTLSGRKSPLETMDCFIKAFPKDKYPNARLELKTRLGILGLGENMLLPLPDPERITVHNETWHLPKVRDWLLGADCMLFLSKGEGFGMPPREALATGMPVIFSNHTGMESMAHPTFNWPVPWTKKESCPIGGDWRIPDWDYAIDAMRWVYEHREEAYQRAYEGGRWFIETQGADAAAARLQAIIEGVDPQEEGLPARPPAEGIERGTIRAHRDFWDYVEQHVPKPGPILDFGVGRGTAYHALTERGYQVWGLCFPNDYERVRTLLQEAGYNEPRLVPFNLFGLSKLQLRALPVPPVKGAVSCGFLQDYGYHEVRRLLRAAQDAVTPVLVSMPSVHYPRYYGENANLWQLGQWRDLLLGLNAPARYYGEGKRYLLAHVQGLAITAPVAGAAQHGRLIDGEWRAFARAEGQTR